MKRNSSTGKLLRPIDIPPEYATKFSFLNDMHVLFFRTVMRLTSKRDKVVRVLILDNQGNMMLYTDDGVPKRKLDLTKDVAAVFDDTNNRIVFHFKKVYDLAVVFQVCRTSMSDMTPRRFMAVATQFIPSTVPIIRVDNAFERIENLTEKTSGHAKKGDTPEEGEGDLGLRRLSSNVKAMKRNNSVMSDGDLLGESLQSGAFGNSFRYSGTGSEIFAAQPDDTDGPAFADSPGTFSPQQAPSSRRQSIQDSSPLGHEWMGKRLSVDSSGAGSHSSFRRQQMASATSNSSYLQPHDAQNSFYDNLTKYRMNNSTSSTLHLPPALAAGDSGSLAGSLSMHPHGDMVAAAAVAGTPRSDKDVTVEDFLALCAKERVEEELVAAKKQLVLEEAKRAKVEESMKSREQDERTARNLSALVLAVCRRRRQWLDLEAQAGYEERVLMATTQLRKQTALSQSPARWTRDIHATSTEERSGPTSSRIGTVSALGEQLERHYDGRVDALL